jgi:predicted DNA binding protein
MPSYEARIEVSHDCHYCHLTERYPEAQVLLWCNGRDHMLEVSDPPPGMIREIERQSGGGMHYLLEEESFVALTVPCDCDETDVSHHIIKNDCWHVPPALFKGGWEEYRVFSWDKENITALVEDIRGMGGRVKVVSLRPKGRQSISKDMVIPSSTILADLTGKQIDTLLDAYNLGYFDMPARVDLDSMAQRAGVARSTYAEHLRKAQAKLLKNMFPLIRMSRERQR